jgi:hypothetical protein
MLSYREEQKRFVIELFTGKTLKQWQENNKLLKKMKDEAQKKED